MNDLPFTSEQFFQVFRDYNQQVWPAQFVLLAIALAVVWGGLAGSRRGTRVGWSLLAGLWLLLGWTAVRGSVALSFSPRGVGALGAGLVACALVLYPVIGLLAGHAYLSSPTFGLPCPLTIFTLGVLLWARPQVPAYLLIIPVMWAVIGSSAFLAFGVWQDTLLPLAALLATVARLGQWRNAVRARAEVATHTH